jgi:eukaryotic-like serine/threonine-protein kinase
LYDLLASGPPFRGACLNDILQAHQSMEAIPLNRKPLGVPEEPAALVAKMMAKEPERRFQRPKDAAQALTPFFKKGDLAYKNP